MAAGPSTQQEPRQLPDPWVVIVMEFGVRLDWRCQSTSVEISGGSSVKKCETKLSLATIE